MKRVGLFLDVSNLYYCLGLKYKRKLNYAAYRTFCNDFGDIVQAIAYGAQIDNEAANFIRRLKELTFTTKYKPPKVFKSGEKKADWDVGITIDMVQSSDRLDLIVLGSADSDLAPAVEWAKNKGITVIVLACGISKELKEVATKWIEIPESLLESKRDVSNRPSNRRKRQQPAGSKTGTTD